MFSIIASLTVTLVLQIHLRTWSYYFYPIRNIQTLESAAKLIPSTAQMFTHGVGSPWVTYNKICYIPERFQPEIINKLGPEYILINLRTVFWEQLSEGEIELLKMNLRKLNSNKSYHVIFYENDIVVLKKSASNDLGSVQLSWSDNLKDFEGINQVRMKPEFIRLLRVW